MPLNVCLYTNDKNPGVLFVDFDALLHRRGTDWIVYKNSWDAGITISDASDSTLICELVESMMDDFSGVSEVQVKNYRVVLKHSRAVTTERLIELVLAAIARVETDLHVTDETQEEKLPYVPLTVTRRRWYSRRLF